MSAIIEAVSWIPIDESRAEETIDTQLHREYLNEAIAAGLTTDEAERYADEMMK